jgi:hypothetical protein
MKTLWFVSLAAFAMVSCNNFVCRNSQTQIPAGHKSGNGFFDSLKVIKFKTRITFKDTELSGIIIYKKLNDSTCAGSFINEFGLKGFDFSVANNRTRLGYTFSRLDKWYIRRTLEADINFMLSEPKLLKACIMNNRSVMAATITNSLHYVYYPADKSGIYTAEMYRKGRRISSLQEYYNGNEGFVLKLLHHNRSLRYELSELKN